MATPTKRSLPRPLEGQVALITGGGKGIGRTIALALAARGVRVVVTGRDERALGNVVGEIANGGGKARHLVGEVRDPSHLRAATEKAKDAFGGLDIAIANAGLTLDLPLGAENPTNASAIININLMGAYYMFDAAVRAIPGPGRLLVVTRALGKMGAGYAATSASNGGVLGLVRATAEELAPRGITCNALCPRPERVEDEAHGEDAAALVLFLCSSAGDAITGQSLAF